MKYGFVIDNRKCIGCHACTTACKSEHQVPVGVNRTWVKQVEKGSFPDTRRLFSVMRCNHCTDAPCVDICPVEALYIRDDGIVDFDHDRCIGCKSCMQACPYDALYINPENNTAAKCNYCAHRIDLGLEPACVNVCPEHAIISGDMNNPESEIAQLLARQATKVRKPEKNTRPNLFYIDADDVSLIPTATKKSPDYVYSSQSVGVGHYAKEAEKLAFSNGDVITALEKIEAPISPERTPKTVEVIMNKSNRAYDAPDKGILWGWEVSAYVWTKAISSGIVLLLSAGHLFHWFGGQSREITLWGLGLSLLFLALTGLFLILDLDRPDRFLNVLLRPQWSSWLVRGGYAITVFGGLLSLTWISFWLGWATVMHLALHLSALVAVVVAIYTAFLFAQAKGRDFWQSPILPMHMLVHAALAGSVSLWLLAYFLPYPFQVLLDMIVLIISASIIVNLLVIALELIITHPTKDANMVAQMIVKGPYKRKFWLGLLLIGNIIPLLFFNLTSQFLFVPATLVLLGIFITEHIWVEAPQQIPLS